MGWARKELFSAVLVTNYRLSHWPFTGKETVKKLPSLRIKTFIFDPSPQTEKRNYTYLGP